MYHGVENFSVLIKSRTEFDCLLYEMIFMKELEPSLNVPSDSICAKVFKQTGMLFQPLIIFILNSIFIDASHVKTLILRMILDETSKRLIALIFVFLVKIIN